MTNKKFIGNEGEKLAVDFLNSKGVEILERNFYSHGGEIDVIFIDGEYLVFGEIKSRINTSYGNPFDAINYTKRLRMIKSARYYLYKYRYPENTKVRFDAIGILNGNVKWIKNAFEV